MSERDAVLCWMLNTAEPTWDEDDPDYQRATRALDALMRHEARNLMDRARRGVDVLEEHVGGFQYSRDVREILDVVDPTKPDPDGWNF